MLTNLKAIYSVFDAYAKRKVFSLFFLMLSLAFFEIAGVLSLFPYIKMLSDPSVIQTSHFLKALYDRLHFAQENSFLIFFGFVVLAMIIARGVFFIANTYMQARFIGHMQNHLSKLNIESYMNTPYDQILFQNSSVVSKHLLIEVTNAITVITQGLILLTNAITAIALISIMMWLNPYLVIFGFLSIGLLAKLLLFFTKKVVSKIGKESEQCYRDIFQAAHEALLGIKDIKSYNAEHFFSQRFLEPTRRASVLNIKFKSLSEIPGVVIQAVGFAGLLSVMLYLLFKKGDLINILPTLAIIAMTLQRLLPSSNAIYGAISAIRRNWPGFCIVKEKVDEHAKTPPSFQDNDLNYTQNSRFLCFETLKLERLTYRYPLAPKEALIDLNLEIRQGESIGIIGTSGAGKSTLVDILVGLLPGFQGSIYYNEAKITSENSRVLRRLIGYVPQQTFLIDRTIKENIAFGISVDKIDFVALNRAITIAQLDKFLESLPEGVETWIGERGIRVSGGQRQRIGIARALYRDPDVLIMDEATNALDSATEQEFNESLKLLMNKKTLIIIAKRISSIKMCQRIVMLSEGCLVSQGNFEEFRSNESEFLKVYGSASQW